eukprot:363282-Chlamydomonas_euryale.AAC.1
MHVAGRAASCLHTCRPCGTVMRCGCGTAVRCGRGTAMRYGRGPAVRYGCGTAVLSMRQTMHRWRHCQSCWTHGAGATPLTENQNQLPASWACKNLPPPHPPRRPSLSSPALPWHGPATAAAAPPRARGSVWIGGSETAYDALGRLVARSRRPGCEVWLIRACQHVAFPHRQRHRLRAHPARAAMHTRMLPSRRRAACCVVGRRRCERTTGTTGRLDSTCHPTHKTPGPSQPSPRAVCPEAAPPYIWLATNACMHACMHERIGMHLFMRYA